MAWITIAWKDIRLQLGDWVGLIWLFVTPIIVITVASFALSGLFNPTYQVFTVPVVQLDHGKVANQIVSNLRKLSALHIETTAMNGAGKVVPLTIQQARTKVQSDKAAIVIPQGFSRDVANGKQAALIVLQDPTDKVVPSVVSNILSKIVAGIQLHDIAVRAEIQGESNAVAALSAQVGHPLRFRLNPAQIARSSQAIIAHGQLRIQAQSVISDAAHTPSAFQSNVPGYAVMFMLFGTSFAGASLLSEKESGTLLKLRSLPIRRVDIIGGKLSSNFIVALLQAAILFAVGRLVFGMWLGNSLAGLCLLIIVTAFSATGLGMLIAALSKTRSQATGLSILIILTSSALGGSWWPLYIVPHWMQTFAHITLTAWSMDGFNQLLVYGNGLSAILPSVTALVVMGLLFFSIALWRFRWD